MASVCEEQTAKNVWGNSTLFPGMDQLVLLQCITEGTLKKKKKKKFALKFQGLETRGSTFIHLLKFVVLIILLFCHQPATPSRPPVVVDWASGVAPKPDPRTISKHVQRMVDVSVLFQVQPPHLYSVRSLYNQTLVLTVLLDATALIGRSRRYCSLTVVQRWRLSLVSHSPCLRTTTTTRTASYLKGNLRRLPLAFRSPSALWTKQSECLAWLALSSYVTSETRKKKEYC